MGEVLSFADIDGLTVEPLPARTVLSLLSTGARGGGDAGNDGAGNAVFNMLSDPFSHQIDSAGTGFGGAAGSANAGSGG